MSLLTGDGLETEGTEVSEMDSEPSLLILQWELKDKQDTTEPVVLRGRKAGGWAFSQEKCSWTEKHRGHDD